jgi:hypothetical protein
LGGGQGIQVLAKAAIAMENADLAQAIKAAASLYFTPEMGEHIGGSKAAERFTGTTGGNAHQAFFGAKQGEQTVLFA